MSRVLANYMINIGVNNIGTRRGLRRAERSVSRSMGRISASIKSMIAGLGITSIGLAFFQGAKAAATFEDTMTKVRINSDLLGKSGEEAFQKLVNKARELGTTSRFSATQSAEAMNMLALAGLSVNEVYSATGPLLDMATAASLDLADASAIATTQMKIWQKTAEDLSYISDVLTSAQSKMRTTVSDLNEGMAISGAMAKKVGLDFAELTAVTGLLQERSNSASKAGVALSIAFGRLAKPSKETQEILNDLKINLENFRDAGTGEIDFFRAMQEFADKGATDIKTMKMLFGDRGKEIIKLFDVVSESGKVGVAAIEEMAGALRSSSGFAEKAASAMKKTFIGRLLELKSAIEEIAIAFLGPMLDGIMSIMKPFTEFVRWIARFDKESQGLLSDILKISGAFLGLSIAIPAVIATISTFVTTISTPIGILIGLLVGVVVGIIRLQKFMKKNPNVKWVKDLNKAFTNLKMAAINVWETIKTSVTNAWIIIGEVTKGTVFDMEQYIKDFSTITGEVLAAWALDFSVKVKVLSENFGLAWDMMYTQLKLTVLKMKIAFFEFAGGVESTLTGMFTFLSHTVAAFADGFAKGFAPMQIALDGAIISGNKLKQVFASMVLEIAKLQDTAGNMANFIFGGTEIKKEAAAVKKWGNELKASSQKNIDEAQARIDKASETMLDQGSITDIEKKARDAANKASKGSKSKSNFLLNILGIEKSLLDSKMKELTGRFNKLVEKEKRRITPGEMGPEDVDSHLRSFPTRITPAGVAPPPTPENDFIPSTTRHSFDSFGSSIQDAILKKEGGEDKKQTSLLEKTLMTEEETVKAVKSVEKAIAVGLGLAGTLT